MNTRPTPETDKNLDGWEYHAQYGWHDSLSEHDPLAWPEFARKLERERDEWKAKYIQQNKDLGCEMMDPNGTIWDHAKTLQRERDEARRQANDMREKWLAKGLCCEHLGAELHEAINQRDEARGQLAGIEDKMRVELGGHPNSKLWGEAGLIAATMRCVDALGEVTDQRDRLAEALQKLADCDWVITPHDRMDAVREIAREALQSLTPNETISK